MRVALLTDGWVLRREGVMLRRVAIGLIDEGVNVISIEPRTVTGVTARGIGGGPVPLVLYEDRGAFITRPLRVDRIAKDLKANDLSIDVVHVLGRRTWRIALDLAKRTDAALCLDVHTRGGLRRLPAFENLAQARLDPPDDAHDDDATARRPAHASREATDSKHIRARFAAIAADGAVADAAQDALQRTPVHTVPWGVHRRGEWRGERPAEQRPGIAILAEHNKPDLLAAALAGVAKLPDDVMAFIDEEASGNGRVWKLAGQLGIRDRVDVVPSLEGNRELALRCDVLAAPGPTGRHRSVVLDAMAAGVAVVGIRDPLIEALNTPDFAWLLDEDEPDAWADAFREALGYTESARDRRIAAKSFVDEQRRPFAHIGGLLDVYTALTAPETIRFAQAR